MSLTKYVSPVQHVDRPVEAFYAQLADLRSLNALRARLDDPAVAQRLADSLPEGKAAELTAQLQSITFEEDGLSISSPVGQLALRVTEREAPKLVKLSGENTPVDMHVWIQLLPDGPDATKLRVTVGAEVSFFMKGLVAKPLQQAADGLAQLLAHLPATPGAPNLHHD